MVKYEIRTGCLKIAKEDRAKIRQWCAAEEAEAETLRVFDSLEEAEDIFYKYDTSEVTRDEEGNYLVREYWIEENNYAGNEADPDEWLAGGDGFDCSRLPDFE